MARIKRIRLFPFAKFQAVLVAQVGVIAGILYSFGGLIIDLLVSIGWVSSAETPGLSIGTVLAFGALIGMLIIFGAFGFIAGLLESMPYNLFSGLVGGVEIDLLKSNG